MNKNILLVLASVAIFIVVGLLFISNPTSPVSSVSQNATNDMHHVKENVQIAVKEEQHQKRVKKEKQKKIETKIDPTIKAATIDHYNTYLIQLVDRNPEDKNIRLSKNPETYRYLEGKISGKQFVMRVPKEILDKSDIKLKITNLKTKETKSVDASFLSELDSMPMNGSLKVNIDFNDPNNILTEAKLPEENPPFPGLQER